MSAGISTPVKRRGMAVYFLVSRSPRLGNQLFNLRQDTRHDYVDTGGGRMQAIGLIEFGVAGHPVEEEWIKKDRMSRGKRRKDRIEGLYIVGAEVARRLHARQQDNNMTIFERVQDRVERRLGELRVDAEQRVVGAKLGECRLGSLRHRPIEATEPARSR